MRTGKMTNRNRLVQALDEMETFGFGIVPKKKAAPKKRTVKKTTTKYRPRSAAEVKAQTPAPKKGLIEKTLDPFIKIGVLGLAAYLAITLVPKVLDVVASKKAETK